LGPRLYFRVVLHDLMHQMFGHLLADEPIPLACQFCDKSRQNLIRSSAVKAPSFTSSAKAML
jgi:hypothetical protein